MKLPIVVAGDDVYIFHDHAFAEGWLESYDIKGDVAFDASGYPLALSPGPYHTVRITAIPGARRSEDDLKSILVDVLRRSGEPPPAGATLADLLAQADRRHAVTPERSPLDLLSEFLRRIMGRPGK